MKVIRPNNSKFTNIFHISDIHIRLNKRHKEYKSVFEELYEEVKNTPETTIVAILGDIFHSKVELSPECVQLASDFFKNLANIRPTILIAGNHDAILSNKDRMDSLTPIVNVLDHSNFFYLRESGLYGFGNILFNVMSVFDPSEKYIIGTEIPSTYKNQYDYLIALFHGPIDGACLEGGMRINNPNIVAPLFDGHDLVLLGDIHYKQDIQEYDFQTQKPYIRYAGSLIQQSHGELFGGHGFSMWDLKTRTYTHKDLFNENGFFTIEIHRGKLVTNISSFSPKIRLRVKCFETIPSEVKQIISDIKKKHEILEITYVRLESEQSNTITPLQHNVIINNLSDVKYQNTLIEEYLSDKLKSPKDFIKKICEINDLVNTKIIKTDAVKNVKWKPIKFEFDNMFSYGEGNVIDFTKLNGVYGIFGPNKCGKSSIFSAMTFCLFDKFDRGFKGSHVRNVEKSGFRCKFEFEISGVRYFVERIGHPTRTGNVKVDVSFWKEENGIKEDLHGIARRDTNEIIRDYIGSYEDFILTTLLIQASKNNISFIDMGNTERKDLLVKFMGLDVFDQLTETASERNKELNVLLKVHKNNDYIKERSDYESSLEQTTLSTQAVQSEIENLKNQIKQVNLEIIDNTKKLHPVDVDDLLDITEINKILEKFIKLLDGENDLLIKDESKLSQIELKIKDNKDKLQKINIKEVDEHLLKLSQLKNEIHDKEKIIAVEISNAKTKFIKSERLKTHKYDPNCEYCVNNEFVQDALKAKEELKSDKININNLTSEINKLKKRAEQYLSSEEEKEIYTNLLSSLNTLNNEANSLNKKIFEKKTKISEIKEKINKCEKDKETFNHNKQIILENKKINSYISTYKITLKTLDIKLSNQEKLYIECSNKLNLFLSKIKDLNKKIEEVKSLEEESLLYKTYISVVGRDGIPYELILKVVPKMEKEINSILHSIADFTIQLETDGKNVIPYIVYDQRKWPIEMTSGFERFVSSLAIRVALTEVSNLPRASMFLCDEGFGVLDGDNMPSMFTLFSNLKHKFDFIVLISHIDSMKDAVDKQIEIQRDGNFSKIIFE